MVSASFSPKWFYGFDVLFELMFFIILLFVAILAYKLYKKASQKNIGLFGLSFFLIAISYLIQSILNFLIISELNEHVCTAMQIQSTAVFNNMGILIHILFMTLGLSMLTVISFKQENSRLFWLIISLSFFGICLSGNPMYFFYLFSSIFLIFISWYYTLNYLKNKQSKTLLVALAFLFLLFGNIHFLFSVNHQLFYVIGHILELIAYLLILINYHLILKK